MLIPQLYSIHENEDYDSLIIHIKLNKAISVV